MVESSFSEQFSHYLVPRESVERAAFDSGLIVLDANVLLDVYRYAPEARNQLLSVMEKLRDRIWIPHQVAEEFYRNRVGVMVDSQKIYNRVLDLIEEADKALVESLEKELKEMANRVLLQEEKEEVVDLLKSALLPLSDKIRALEENHRLDGSLAEDPILERLEDLFKNRVGKPFVDDFEARMKEAKRRRDERIPPGYKDSAKDTWYGDCFVWLQALDQVRVQSSRTLLIVTEDIKEDWYRRLQGQTISARPELALEAKRDARCDLVIMRVSSFLLKANQYSDVEVSDRTIREAEKLSSRRDLEVRLENARISYVEAQAQYANQSDMVSAVSEEISSIKLHLQEIEHDIHAPSEVENIDQLVQRRSIARERLDAFIGIRKRAQDDSIRLRQRAAEAEAYLGFVLTEANSSTEGL